MAKELDKDTYTIVPDHPPNDHAAEAETTADLVLSGHTHGGQMIPLMQFMRRFHIGDDTVYGLERQKNTDLIVTSGISYTLVRTADLTGSGDTSYHLHHAGEKAHSRYVSRGAVAALIVKMIQSEDNWGLNEGVGITDRHATKRKRRHSIRQRKTNGTYTKYMADLIKNEARGANESPGITNGRI